MQKKCDGFYISTHVSRMWGELLSENIWLSRLSRMYQIVYNQDLLCTKWSFPKRQESHFICTTAVQKKKYLLCLSKGCKARVVAYLDFPAISWMQSGAAGVEEECPDQWQTLSGTSRQKSDPVDILNTERTSPVSKQEPAYGHRLNCW